MKRAENVSRSGNHQGRERVADTPNCANHRGVADLAASRDDYFDRYDMIGIIGMPRPEEKANYDNGDEADHRLVERSFFAGQISVNRASIRRLRDTSNGAPGTEKFQEFFHSRAGFR